MIGKLFRFLQTDQGKGVFTQLLNNQAEYSPMVNRRVASEPDSNVVERRLKSR
jgi:hypothetical protein